MKRTTLLLTGLALLFCFTLFSLWIKRGNMRELDFAVTIKVQERIDTSARLRLARMTGDLMEGATVLASPLSSLFIIAGITMITIINRKRWRLVALVIPIAFVLMTVAEIYGKVSVHHPAPPFFLLKNPTTVFPKYYVWEYFSYPSGHAARAVFIAWIVWFLTMKQYNNRTMSKRFWTILLLGVYVPLISVSRIYLGHHWLSDVLGGWLLGSSSGLLTSALLLPYNSKRL